MTNYLTPLSKAILTGLFAGIAATFICIGYNMIWRDESHFPLFNFINVSSLIFGVNTLFVLVGLIYYCFIRAFKQGTLFYIGLFIILTIFCIIKIPAIHRSNVPLFNIEFHHLLIAMVIIMGISAVAVPWLYNSKRFEEHVL